MVKRLIPIFFFLLMFLLININFISADIYSEDGLYGTSVTNITYTYITNYINSTAWERSGTNVFLTNINDKVGIGTNAPNSTFHIKANIAGSVGSHSAGQIIIQNPADSVFSNVVITAYESDGAGNPDQQLWYLGSSSVSNTDITFLNRRNANLHLGTNGVSRLTILGDGSVGIGTTTPQNLLNVLGDLNVTGLIINPAIYCESSELIDQTFASAGVRYRLNISNVDEGNGITMTTGNNGTNITIDTSGVYHLVAQPQVKAGAGGAGDFHMWIEKHNTTQWVDIPDSNIELKLSSLEEDVIVLATTLKLNQGEKLRLIVSVSDNKILLHAQSPAGEPIIPSIIFTMYRIGN